ncbi:hypothetical protein AC578_2469 [Pseudocercospora eumusae]|uniref:F-box domain-containing protein n=1 Tax=Pseudocercospora eumusae TaxID=321146 RepID=A0A139HXC1_9PEZI|nr:hypothetical protein AC578_2469 [Pseudocercospora eumusae]
MESQTRSEVDSNHTPTCFLDLPKELLLHVSEYLDTKTLCELRLTCKTLGAAVIDQWFPKTWVCPILHPSCIENLLHVSQTARLVNRLDRVRFALDADYQAKDVHVARKKDMSHSDAQDAHIKQLYQSEFDVGSTVDCDKIVAICRSLKLASCMIELDLMNTSGAGQCSRWTGSGNMAVLDITDSVIYALARSNVSIYSLAMCGNGFHESSLRIRSQGIYDLKDVTKDLRQIYYNLMPYTTDWNQGNGDVAMSNRMGAVKAIESASKLRILFLVGFGQRHHPQIDLVRIASKFLLAVRSPVLRCMYVHDMDCTASDLAQVIRNCKESLTYLALENIRLHCPGSKLLLMKELQVCSKLQYLCVSKKGSWPLMHRGAFEVFSLKHYDSEDKADVIDSESVSWKSKEEVQKVLEYNLGQIKE